MLGHAGKDLRNLSGGFAGGEDNFWHAGAERSMMIDFGKAKVFEGKIAETIEGVSDGRAALADFIKQRLNALAIHQNLPSPR
jgi:hypothetical protein